MEISSLYHILSRIASYRIVALHTYTLFASDNGWDVRETYYERKQSSDII